MSGETLTGTVTRQFDGNEIKLHYKGKVSGDETPRTVNGSIGGQDFEIQITAKREK